MYIELHGSRQAEWEGGGGYGEGREGEGRGGEGKLHGRYPEEGTGQYTVYAHKPSHNAALALETLVLQMKWRGRGGEGKLHGRYPEEGTGQYTVYSHKTIPQRGPCP